MLRSQPAAISQLCCLWLELMEADLLGCKVKSETPRTRIIRIWKSYIYESISITCVFVYQLVI